jgi:hypothetical protein
MPLCISKLPVLAKQECHVLALQTALQIALVHVHELLT